MNKSFIFVVAISILSLITSKAHPAIPTIQIDRSFTEIPPTFQGFYGDAIDMSESYLAVGAIHISGSGGSVAMFSKTNGNWSLDATLTPNPNTGEDHFGNSVSISGDTVAIGSTLNDTHGLNTGAVYVYKKSAGSWALQQQLFADNTGFANLAAFGRGVALQGDALVVGNPRDDDLGVDSGSVYVFERNGNIWTQQSKIIGSHVVGGDEFGHAVAISGTHMAVASVNDDDRGLDSGSVTLYKHNGFTWVETQYLLGSGTQATSQFGSCISIDGNVMAIGAPRDNLASAHQGAVYIYRYDGSNWVEEAVVNAQSFPAGNLGEVFNDFGHSLSLQGDRLLVGSLYEDINGQHDRGAGYLFERVNGTWVLTNRFISSDQQANNQFASSVALSGDDVAFGGRGATVNGFTAAGAVYIGVVPEPATAALLLLCVPFCNCIANHRRGRRRNHAPACGPKP